jgi:superoxide dismutase, Fe-Mn family
MFILPALMYEYDALGANISADIMRLHHGKHHQTYVDKLNAALASSPDLTGRSIQSLIAGVAELPESIQAAVRNHGGGHYNHSLFWQWMSPDGGGQPTGQLADAIVARYGSFQAFVDEFTTKSLAIFGSGWTWLQPDMTIITTANQDTPLLIGQPEPLLGLDVWEHAYYLDYKNKRDDYVAAWWNVVNWDFVASRMNT